MGAEAIVDGMGTFRTTIELEHPGQRGPRVLLRDVLVDTGAEATWIPGEILSRLGIQPERMERYLTADGRILERQVGFALVHVAGKATADDVVFGEQGDLTILGARSLEGLNLRVDARAKQLVTAGPIVAALAV